MSFSDKPQSARRPLSSRLSGNLFALVATHAVNQIATVVSSSGTTAVTSPEAASKSFSGGWPPNCWMEVAVKGSYIISSIALSP
jgi:hypothetical protein